jgi:glutamate dehydrogenase
MANQSFCSSVPMVCDQEGTADMMDWAARKFSYSFISIPLKNLPTVHARSRGAETWWKSFTSTGKSAETVGGVPHDTYGMTSLSIRQYVLGIYK